MFFRDVVERRLYDEAVSERRRYENQFVSLALDSVPKGVHEAMIAALRQQIDSLTLSLSLALERSQTNESETMKEAMALKRHETGLYPKQDTSGFDPMANLGPKTQMAIEEFSAGDAETRKYLIGRAQMEWSALASDTEDVDMIDLELAEKIMTGDRG